VVPSFVRNGSSLAPFVQIGVAGIISTSLAVSLLWVGPVHAEEGTAKSPVSFTIRISPCQLGQQPEGRGCDVDEAQAEHIQSNTPKEAPHQEFGPNVKILQSVWKAAGPFLPGSSEEAAKILLEGGTGLLLGAASGYTLKKVGRAGALLVGSSLILLQFLAHKGYIDIKWEKIEEDLATDLSKIKTQSVESYIQEITSFLTQGMKATAGFLPGFYLGLKYG